MMWKRMRSSGLTLFVITLLLISASTLHVVGEEDEAIKQQPPDDLDISITNLTFSNPEPEEGEVIIISVTVRNNMAQRIDDLTLSLMRFDQNITEKEISIGPEEEETFDFEWEAIGGTQTITAVLSAEVFGEEIRISVVSENIDVEPEPLGDIYSPVLAMIFIFAVIFGSVLIPSIVASFSGKSKDEDSK